MSRLAVALVLLTLPAHAATLLVGPERAIKTPGAASAAVQDGDTVLIDPGEYFDCAIWSRDRLVVAGAGGGDVVVTDKACEGKAVFVLRGNGITVRDITLARARVLDGNGAGIRVEGRDATLERVGLVNNQAGLLAGGVPDSRITIVDGAFVQNGACGPARCAHGLQVGPVALLRVTGTRFSDPRGGDQISSQAARTELIGVSIEDGDGTSRYLVDLPLGGLLDMSGSRLAKGPGSSDPAVAIMVGESGGWSPEATLRLTGTTLSAPAGAGSLLRNWSDAQPVLSGNAVPPGFAEVSREGIWWHRIRSLGAELRGAVWWAVSQLRHFARAVLGS